MDNQTDNNKDEHKHRRRSHKKDGHKKDRDEPDVGKKRRSERQPTEPKAPQFTEEELAKQKAEREEKEKRLREEEEQRRKAEEELRQEEERKRQQAMLQEEEERLSKIMKSYTAKAELKQANETAAQTPVRDDNTKGLDSSLKRNTAFVKKLKTGVLEEQRASIIKEASALNLSKYITEVASAVIESIPKMRSGDVMATMQLCSSLHQRYSEFSTSFVSSLRKIFAPVHEIAGKKWEKSMEPDAETQLKRRMALRMMGELFVVSFHNDFDLLRTTIQGLCRDNARGSPGLREGSVRHYNIAVITSLVRNLGDDLLGLPVKIKEFPSLPASVARPTLPSRKNLVPTAQQDIIRSAVVEYVNVCSSSLLAEHQILKDMEREFQRLLATKGDGDEAAMAATHDKFRKLQSYVNTLAELMDLPLPQLIEEENTTRMGSGDAVIVSEGSQNLADNAVDSGPFDDTEEKMFYEDLPDLKALVPGVLLGVDPTQKDDKDDTAASQPSAETPAATPTVDQPPAAQDPTPEDDKDETAKDPSLLSPFGMLLARLKDCVNKELIDSWAVEFCYLNSKAHRKRLARALFGVPRTQLDLLQYYARLVATLTVHFKDIGENLVYLLDEELTFLQQRKKDLTHLETKVKDIRFLAELVKFKVCPPNTVFTFLRVCLDDLTPHNIEIACNLLEVCGRFLYRFPATAVRMGNMLDIFARLKQVKIHEARLEMMAESAILACRPPKRATREQKPPLQLFITHLLTKNLDSNTMEKVGRKMRKLPWGECEDYVRSCILNLNDFRFDKIRCIASLLSYLSRYRRSLVIGVVDCLLEQFRVDLEENDFRKQQSRVTVVCLIAELFNHRLINSNVIFDMLYQLIEIKEGDDSRHDTFRVRLVATILMACGHRNCFTRTSGKIKLDTFLVYFQHYHLRKDLGMDMSFVLCDLYDHIRPQMKRFTTADEAAAEVAKIEAMSGRYQVSKHTIISENNTGMDSGDDDDDDAGDDDDDDDDDGADNVEGKAEKQASRHDTDSSTTATNAPTANAPASTTDASADAQPDVVEIERYKRPQAHEDVQFDQELLLMMQESVKEARQNATRNSALARGSIRLPEISSVPHAAHNHNHQQAHGSSMTFKLFVRRGQKQSERQLQVPIDSSLAQFSQRQTQEDRNRQIELKRAVLDYEKREAQAENSDSLPQVNNEFARPRGRGQVLVLSGSTGVSGSAAGASGGRGRGRGRGLGDQVDAPRVPSYTSHNPSPAAGSAGTRVLDLASITSQFSGRLPKSGS